MAIHLKNNSAFEIQITKWSSGDEVAKVGRGGSHKLEDGTEYHCININGEEKYNDLCWKEGGDIDAIVQNCKFQAPPLCGNMPSVPKPPMPSMPSVDLPSAPSMPSVDMPSVDMPSVDMPSMPSVDLPSMPTIFGSGEKAPIKFVVVNLTDDWLYIFKDNEKSYSDYTLSEWGEEVNGVSKYHIKTEDGKHTYASFSAPTSRSLAVCMLPAREPKCCGRCG